MRAKLIFVDKRMERVRELTGIEEKTALARATLTEQIVRETGKRLAVLGGTQPKL